MNPRTRLKRLAAAALVAVPLLATAQTANTPGGQASTGSALDQTKGDPGSTAPKTTSTTPTVTNPAGKSSHRQHHAKAAPTEPGDAPTYPAPAADGTPTK